MSLPQPRYFRIAGFDAPEAMPADCLRFAFSAPGRSRQPIGHHRRAALRVHSRQRRLLQAQGALQRGLGIGLGVIIHGGDLPQKLLRRPSAFAQPSGLPVEFGRYDEGRPVPPEDVLVLSLTHLPRHVFAHVDRIGAVVLVRGRPGVRGPEQGLADARRMADRKSVV